MATQGFKPAQWQAVHIFYAGNPRPLLTQCIDPLVNGLIVDGLVTGWFFVHYWLEGPHIRLRLKPRPGADTGAIRGRTEVAVGTFLEDRPVLYEVKPEFLIDFYSTVIELDYSPEQRERLLGADGQMRLRPNNTFSFEPYEPEYARYGGPAGMELAEWHFRHSSDLALELARGTDTRRRASLLSLAAQLMMVTTTAFLRHEPRIAEFLARYHEFWLRTFSLADPPVDTAYDRDYDAMGADVARRLARVRRAFAPQPGPALPGPFQGWADHCVELRERAVELASRGELVFQSWNPGGRPADPATALELLLAPILRMMNNRLQVPMRDEPYLAYALERSLRDSLAREAWA